MNVLSSRSNLSQTKTSRPILKQNTARVDKNELARDVVISDFTERDAPRLYDHIVADRTRIASFLDYAGEVTSPQQLVEHVASSRAQGMLVRTIRHKNESVGMAEIRLVGDHDVDLVRSWGAKSISGLGVMVAYVERIIEEFGAKGRRAILGSVREDNASSIRFIKAAGGTYLRSYSNAEGTFHVYRNTFAPQSKL